MRGVGKWLVTRSLENPSTPLDDPDDWLYDAMGGTPSSSGVRVGRESALSYSPFWRGVNLISRDVGKLPLHIYKRVGDGKERASEHAGYGLLRWKPNTEMTAFVFRQTLQSHALTEGNGIAYVFRNGRGDPIELIPLLPGKAWPVRENGKLMYVTDVNGTWRKLLKENVLHIKGLSFDGLTGYPLHHKAKNSLGLGMAAEEFGSRYFRNGAEPSVVIEHPGKLSPQAATNLRESWTQMHAGLTNAHKAAILEEGMKVNSIGSNARQSQLIETRAFQIREVANFLNLPPHKLGDTTHTSFASLEQENQSYLDDALDPWLVNWEEECRDKLLTEEEKDSDTHVIEFKRSALVRANLTDRFSAYNIALQSGFMNRDEVRAMENLNPIPGDEGKKFFIPLNMSLTGQEPAAGGTTAVPADDIGDPGDEGEPAPSAEPTDANRSAETLATARKIVLDAAKRMAKRIGTHAKKAEKQGQNLVKWAEKELISDHRAVILEVLTPGIEAANVLLKREIAPENTVNWLLQRVSEVILGLNSTNSVGVAAVIESDLPDAVANYVIGE